MNKEIPLTILGIGFLGFVNVGGIYAMVLGLTAFTVAFWYKIKSDEKTLSNNINEQNSSKVLP